MDSTYGIRTVPLPAKPAFPTRTAGTCASCGAPLSVAGSGVLRHQRTGTVSCRPALDEVDGGWAEPDGWHLGPVATLAPDPGAASFAHRLGELAARYEVEALAGGTRAQVRRHAACSLRELAGLLTTAGAA